MSISLLGIVPNADENDGRVTLFTTLFVIVISESGRWRVGGSGSCRGVDGTGRCRGVDSAGDGDGR